MTSFTENSSWQAWVDFCREMDSTREGFDPDETSCTITSWGRSLGDVTIAEAVALMPARGLKGSEEIGSALWIVQHAFDVFPSSLRAKLLAVLTIDPPFAALAYRHAKGLTEQEKRILWDSFADWMPNMRETLAREIGEPQDG